MQIVEANLKWQLSVQLFDQHQSTRYWEDVSKM